MKFRSKYIFHIYALSALLASLLGSVFTVTPVYAAGITVNTTSDEDNTGASCSLREAITAANTDAAYGGCTTGSGADTITVPAGTYTLTIAGANEDLNATGDLDITSALTINGASAASTIVRAGATPGSGIDRVFQVVGAIPVNISDVTISNGLCTSCNGGGIFNGLGTLTVTNSTFLGNSVTNGGGGGIDNRGILIIANSTFSGNSTPNFGGGIVIDGNGTLTVTNSTFLGNSSGISGGGILINSGTAAVTNSTFSGNSSNYGGGIYNVDTLTVTNSTFSGNSATNTGNGIYNAAALHLKNVLLANSAAGVDCYNFGGNTIATDINNLIVANGPNGSMCGTPSVTTDPGLGALANNGGPTQTFALPTSSIALGAGTNTGCPSTDQRGVTRPQNGACDIGAYESNAQPGPTFVVNTNEDSTDGFCDAYVAGVTDCTLREAITYANSIGGTDTITFAANYTITLDSQLPAVTDTMIITGTGAANTIVQANADPSIVNYRVFSINTGGNLTLDRLTVRNGRTSFGGGINNDGTLAITNSVLANNQADNNGGHIYNSSTGILSIDNTTISGDASLFSDAGGGIFNDGGTVTVNSSTIQNNYTNNAGAGLFNETGGIFTITNSTVTGNHASGNIGGGILTRGTMHIYNNTISGNTGTTGDNIYNLTPGILNLHNTIIANSGGNDDCLNTGTVNSTNSLIESTGAQACGLTHGLNGNIIGLDPKLGSLTGSPAYFMLQSDSNAINAGNDTICAAAPINNTSQGGVTRPVGAHCDIGSYEAGTEINITIGGTPQGSYVLGSGESDRASYAGLNNGPVKVEKASLLPVIASERVAYTPDGGTTWTSFDEMMGLPSNQLTDTYYFPFYNNVEMNTQLRFGNVGTSNTVVTVTIGGVVQGSYFVIPNQSMRLSYNLNSGPVKVQSSGNVPIIASIRFANIESTSPLVVPAFTEMMGLPGNQLTTTYIFPHYNNVEMNTQLRFGNVGTSATNVTVTIGGVVQGVYPVAPSQSVRLFYNLNSGPVKVQSSGGVPIIASMRFANIESESPLVISYFSEMLGLPQASLSTNYWFPIYDNVTHNMQLRFGNMGTTSTTVTVRVGGVEQGSYVVLPNQSQRLFYTLNDGPVQVQSSGGVPIIASIRFAYIESESPLVIGAFSEMLGLPAQQLSSTYLFPWYNNDELDTQMRIAVP